MTTARAAVLGLAFSVPVLAWWAIGDLSTVSGEGAYYDYGPYEVGTGPGVAALVVAALITVAALVDVVHRQRGGAFGPRAWWFVGLLVAAGVLAALFWRVATAGVVGANIGGALAALVGPFLVAGLVIAAVWLPDGPVGIRRPIVLTSVVVACAVGVLALLWVLPGIESGRGVISERAYARVHVGDNHDTVRHQLGRPGSETSWFFAPVPAGRTCDYYSSSSTDGTQYQVCYRDGVVVGKASSNRTDVNP